MQVRPHAITLIELLVVLAILSTMTALLLPAVQAARDSSRRTLCQNNLKQISLALLGHAASMQRFPCGGWGHEWVGVPDRGSSEKQPGGWIYSVLPYIEHGDLHDSGIGEVGAAADDAYSRRLETPINLFTCPGRRLTEAWEISDQSGYVRTPKPFGHVLRVARSDYAINGGTSRVLSFPGPASLDQGDESGYWKDSPNLKNFSGISHLRIGTTLFSIHDGVSHTYLIGEKALDPLHYEDGLSRGDNESMYAGYCTDLHRFAGNADRLNPLVPPMRDGDEVIDPPGFIRFGSAHHDGFYMAYCDGSVGFLGYNLDPEVHFRNGHRQDRGRPLNALAKK